MSQSRPRIEPSQVHRDVYPSIRVSTEYFLRGFDVLRRMNDDVVTALILMTIWHRQLRPSGRKATGIRELSRSLALPYETVRRRVDALKQNADCVVEEGGLVFPPAAQRRRRMADIQRRIHVNAVRLLTDLTRIGVARFVPLPRAKPAQRHLTRDQKVIATAGLGALLGGMRMLLAMFDGDLVKGLVFTAIWAANVKHVTNTAPAAHRAILPDDLRQPVSVMAISDSLRLSYETVRRRTDALVKDGICVRTGPQGLVIRERAFRDMTADAVKTYHLMTALVAEVRAAGVAV